MMTITTQTTNNMPSNINGRNVTRAGTRLNSGLDTITTFDLVTKAPMQICHTTTIKLTSSSSTSNDYLSSNTHISQFTVNSGAALVDGSSYNNHFVGRNAQFIAPVDCYIKSLDGFVNTASGSGCSREDFTISVWRKSVTIGTAATAVNLLFSQDFSFTASANNNTVAVEGTSDSRVGNTTYTIPAQEGVLVSIKRTSGTPCVTINSKITMIFESIDNKSPRGEFMFPSLSMAYNRIDETLNSPDRNFVQLPTPPKTTSE